MAAKRRDSRSATRLHPAPKGRPVDASALAEVRALLGDAPRRRDLLIEHLHRLQDACGHLSDRHLVALAAEMRLTPAEVYEVATFYHHFDVVKEGQPNPPAVTVRVCDSIACALAGSAALLEALRQRVGGRLRVVATPCVGRCEHAPVAVVARNPIHGATTEAVEEAVLAARLEPAPPDAVDYAAYRAAGGYALLAALHRGERDADAVIAAVEASGLRGLGGAGFPSARKWRLVRAEPGPRVVALNADEGEPGTFKDRYCLETDPHRVLEGLLIAAWVVGAEDVFLYLRDEYAAIRALLERELAALEADPPCPLPRLHLRRGAGAYVCGEETALIESLEGKRGEPRLRPPYPAQHGVFGRPTLVHNVETLYWLRPILERGAEWFASHGRRGRRGLRLFSVSGRVARPGVYAAPAGITARELIDEHAGGMLPGHTLYAYLPGGASGGILPARLADVPLDFDTLAPYGCFIGSAAVVVLSDRDRARDAALNLMRFFAHESCGKCTPCRSGTAKAAALMDAPTWDTALLRELGDAMADASICGLGQAAPNAVRCVMEFFGHELAAGTGTEVRA
ncbi:MAG TPA: NAD(P)H-dependent oxidoreductase subunit E [Longimicrobiales bacterium]